jgi:hypothetical protein
MRSNLAVFAAAGITFVLHAILQWYGWALADAVGHRNYFPFFFLSFPVLWFAPLSADRIEPWMALNSAIIGLLVRWAQHRKCANRSVPGE